MEMPRLLGIPSFLLVYLYVDLGAFTILVITTACNYLCVTLWLLKLFC